MAVPYYGDFAEDATVYIPINTFDSNDPAASVTVTNLLNTDVHIHKDGGTTQRNNAAGITMTINYDSITGNHLLIIDTSDNTVADFWQAGHEYQVRVEGITVDSGTINAWVGSFSIERAGGALALIKSATYGLSALKTLLDTTGIKVASIANNAITTASINDGAITNAKVADDVDVNVKTMTAGVITATVIANGAIDAATFAADVDAEIATMIWNAATASYGGAGTYGQAVEDILADTNELQTDDTPTAIAALATTLGAAGAGLTALPWNAAWDAEVQSECTDALNAYDPPTKAELDTAQGAVTVSAIANDAITANAIQNGAIDAATFAANAITSTVIADDAITAAKLNTGAITADAFAANAITNTAVADDVDVNVKTITAGAITATAIAADAITEAKIADNAIAAEHIAAAAIDNATFAADVYVACNVKKINGTSITGDGGATPWGPA